MSSGLVPRRGAIRVRSSRLVKPWGSSRWMSRACSSAWTRGSPKRSPGMRVPVVGDQRRGQGGEGLGAGDGVVADGLGAEQAPVGRKADLPQVGQAGQPLGDAEVGVGVVDGGLGPERPAERRVGPAGCPAGAPSEPCVPLIAAHGSSKPRGRAGWLCWVLPAERARSPRWQEACTRRVWSPSAWAGSPVVDKVAGGYRLAGDLQPPPFPLFGGLGWLIGGQQVVPAERAPRVLPGQQAQGVRCRAGVSPSCRRSAQ